MQLSEEAQLLIRDQVRTEMKASEAMLSELNVYRWAIRTLFVVVLGGSVLGNSKAQEYLDSRIALRNEKVESLVFASELSNQNSNEDALNILNDLYSKTNRLNEFSSVLKRYYFSVAIRTIGPYWQVLPNGFSGQALWDTLNLREDFKGFVEERLRGGDPNFLNQVAWSTLKFDRATDGWERAKSQFTKSEQSAKGDIKAADDFCLALIDIIENKLESARDKLQRAHQASHDYPADTDYDWLQTDEPGVWERIALARGVTGFIDLYKSVSHSLSENTTKSPNKAKVK